jgi:hypothetical protein
VASSSEGFPFNHTAARYTKRVVLDELLRKVPQSPSGGAANTISGADVSGCSSGDGGIRRSSTANSRSTRSYHERSQTWGSPSDFQAEKRKISDVPKSVITPGLSAHLRVQPYFTADVANEESDDGLWIPERAFDVFVHPSSLPEVFLSLEDKTSAILVDLVPIESPPKPPQSREDQGRSGGQDPDFEIKRVTPILEKQPVGGSEREQKGLPASLVVRLFFATKVLRKDDKMVALFVSDDSNVKSYEIPIEIGHVLVSDLVRHQLGVAMCSGVMLNHIKDEWRIAYRQAPSVHIQPIDPPAQVNPEIFFRYYGK